MAVQPYKLLNRSELLHIESAVKESFQQWAGMWQGKMDDLQISCHPADALENHDASQNMSWIVLQADQEQWIAISAVPKLLGQLATGLLSPQANPASRTIEARLSALMTDLATSALYDLGRQFFQGKKPLNEKLLDRAGLSETQCWTKGSGAAAAEIMSPIGSLIVVFSAAQVKAMLSGFNQVRSDSLIPLEKINDTLNTEKLSLQVIAGEAQLELQVLQTIVVGDVIKLDASINEPLQVTNVDGVRLCGAYLGTRNGHKAIQLTK